jgi:hypothetical protein
MSRSTSGTVRTGTRVSDAAAGCGDCGHPFTLHSNGKTECRAVGCHAGPLGTACPGFATEARQLMAS